jgi:hypothetical protein
MFGSLAVLRAGLYSPLLAEPPKRFRSPERALPICLLDRFIDGCPFR